MRSRAVMDFDTLYANAMYEAIHQSPRYYEILTDENNRDIFTLEFNSGTHYDFEQLAVVTYKNNVYALLYLLTPIEGAENDGYMAFRITPEGITVETHENILKKIHKRYTRLYRRQ